jgi:enterochelin esterase-like enzyme
MKRQTALGIFVIATQVLLLSCAPRMQEVPTGRIEPGTITSQALANNLLGDSATRKYFVYLPPGYDTSDKRYPVVYVLHGFTGTSSTFLQETAPKLDRLIAEGKVKPMILVYPDASNRLGGSIYRSSPTIGDYETYITKEFVHQIDSTYRTLPSSDSRGVMGCSMGGDGALHLALKYPDVFGVAAPMSAFYGWDKTPMWETARSGFSRQPQKLSFSTQYIIAIAASTAANPDKPPFYLDMPFEIVDGEPRIVPEVFQKVKAVDPMNDVLQYLEQPIRLKGLLVYQDLNLGAPPDQVEYDLQAVREFHETLKGLGIPHKYVEVEAAHCRFDFSPVLRFMGANLAY